MAESSRDLPTGTVTFLFSDIEGSTTLVQRLDPGAYRELLEQHHRLLREAFENHGGAERGTQGDAFLVIFRDTSAAVAAAVEAQRALAEARWPNGVQVTVRMGLHTGEGIAGGDDYVGVDINRAARIAAAAHGGQVLVSEPTRALTERSLPPGVSLRDLGQHRFKGLDLPEQVHQLTIDGLRTEFPPIRGLSPRFVGVPARATTFLGRDDEIETLTTLLAANRLITLVGPGGTGKTSLAIEFARRVAAGFAEGAVFVPLESTAHAELVGSAIVAGLGLRDTSSRPAREQLLDNLAERELLLVIDNFEHVAEAAPLVGELLAASPMLKVMATSRAPLRLAGEQAFPVAPLPLPAAEESSPARLGTVASVQLFVDRAQHVLPAFTLGEDNCPAVADICRLVDGLPLGIELAVTRIALLGPAGIRDRLAQKMRLPGSSVRDVPSRQRTLTEAIAWSHDLLDEPSRTLLRRLSVFAGGWRLEELEAICQPLADPGEDVVDALANLVDQNLVIARQREDGVRYEMLGTIRDFAAERLAEDPAREEIGRRHAEAFLALAEASAPRLETRDHKRARTEIATERDNVRAAVRWAIDHSVPEVGLRLGAALARHWWLAGEMDEGRTTIEAILKIPGAEAPTTWRIRALEGAGLIYYYAADNDRAIEAYQAQRELARELGDGKGEADAMFNFGFTQDARGRTAEALAYVDEVAERYRALGDERWVARTMWVRANVLVMAGQVPDARRILEDAAARYRTLGDLPYEMQAASALALGSLMFGDRQTAARWFPATLALARELGDSAGITVALPLLALAALEFIDASTAATLLGAFDGLSRRYGIRMPWALQQTIMPLRARERAQAALTAEAFESARAAGAAMSIDEVMAYLDETIGQIQPVAVAN